MKINSLKEVTFNNEDLLKQGYRVGDLVNKTITINTVTHRASQSGGYIECSIAGEGIDSKKLLITGANNIVVKLGAALEQDLLPIEVKVIKLGNSNAYDIM